ncbi:MAG: TonB-dependent receptor [Muribaculaceae bacterium]
MNFFRPLLLLIVMLVAGDAARVLAVPRAAETAAEVPAASRLDSMQYLNEVVVERRSTSRDAVIPAQRLGGKKLESLNALSVADAIRYFSGAQIKDYGGVGGIKSIDIRSMGTNHVGVFYDGLQLGNAQNGQIDLGKYSLDNIEEISMYNGQKSNIFQSAKDFGAAGTIYLRTRQPQFAEGKRTNVKVTMRTGSFGLANPSLLVEQKLGERVTANVSAEYIYATGKYKFRYRKVFSDGTLAWDTTATRQNGDIHSLRVEAGLFGRINNGKWNLKAYFYDSDKGIPGAIVNNVWKNSQRQWDRNFFVQGQLQRHIGERYRFQVNAKYAHDYMRYLNPDTMLMYINNKFWQQELYVSSAHNVAIVKDVWDANVSVDYQWNTLDATLRDFASPTRHSVYAALATAAQLDRFKVQASVLGTFVFDRAQAVSASGDRYKRNTSRHEMTPAVFASYKAVASEQNMLNFRAFAKRAFRMPTFNDLYYTDMGNASLKPEMVDQYDVGLQYTYANGNKRALFHGFNLSADGYYNHVTDKIIAVPKGNGQYRWMMMNLGQVRIWGADVTAQANLRLPGDVYVDASLAYTFQSARDFSDPTDVADEAGTYKGQIAYIPRHSGSAVVHAAWRSIDLNYSFIYVGERYDNSSNIRANYVQPWYTHDLSAGYTWHTGGVKMKVQVEVNNLFNQQYEVIRNYPMPGRNYKLTLSVGI